MAVFSLRDVSLISALLVIVSLIGHTDARNEDLHHVPADSDVPAPSRDKRGLSATDSHSIYGFDPLSRPEIHWNNPNYKPYFDSTAADRNVTAQLGKSTFLRCKLKQVTDETVSWVRQKDLHIISAGDYIYTSDQRFKPKHVDNSDEWFLHIAYVQQEDSGVYECQVSTEPKMSFSFYLTVIEAKAEILGGPSVYVQSGSAINLTCVINQTASPPMFVYWHRDEKVLNFREASSDPNHKRIKVSTVEGPYSVSVLEISKAKASDAGNYSCRPVPQYADPANITVHVMNGENPAAMQHNERNMLTSSSLSLLFISSLLLMEELWLRYLLDR